MDDLKPCPFCGSKPELFEYLEQSIVECESCGLRVERWCDDQPSRAARTVTQYWNTRADLHTAAVAELEAEIATLKAALAPFAKLVRDKGYDGTDTEKLKVKGRSSNRTHKNAYLALDGRFPLIGATTALRKE